ncbi:helix-turn-helix domain-containing protein [Halomonas sp. ATCH28]|uniref:Helix-turn-helix domain-containing protein n=1 Tax=Halomonas gemina TaxID=2945105 RepID=A0ABT0SVW4_9GAMM|nr:YdaS family helix-turn-helix protein [Halomonas gemina]MCL7938799.1 helix-turn-helix domain-containing protein [Halomonas gemina]
MKTRHEGLLRWLRDATDEQVSSTGTTRAYLKQIGYGHKPASPEIAVRVEAATEGAATRRSLRPDDWHVLWPELLTSDTPKVTPGRATATTP